jgi:hypothetical protein
MRVKTGQFWRDPRDEGNKYKSFKGVRIGRKYSRTEFEMIWIKTDGSIFEPLLPSTWPENLIIRTLILDETSVVKQILELYGD